MNGSPRPAPEPSPADVLGWDVRTWAPALHIWDRALTDLGGAPLRALEVGAGPGGPSVWLAMKGHRVLCTNLAATESMARPLAERFGVVDRIEFRDVDLLEGLPHREEFDVVVFKSVLGGLGDDPANARAVIEDLRLALRPGGLLLFAENIRGCWLHRLARRAAMRARGTSWRYPTLRELREILGGFAEVELHTRGVLAVLGVRESQREALARIDEAVLDRVVPPALRYMAFGVARR